MACDFWSKLLSSHQLETKFEYTAVHLSSVESTSVVETLWRRPYFGPSPDGCCVRTRLRTEPIPTSDLVTDQDQLERSSQSTRFLIFGTKIGMLQLESIQVKAVCLL